MKKMKCLPSEPSALSPQPPGPGLEPLEALSTGSGSQLRPCLLAAARTGPLEAGCWPGCRPGHWDFLTVWAELRVWKMQMLKNTKVFFIFFIFFIFSFGTKMKNMKKTASRALSP